MTLLYTCTILCSSSSSNNNNNNNNNNTIHNPVNTNVPDSPHPDAVAKFWSTKYRNNKHTEM
jgi:hypothetical protein